MSFESYIFVIIRPMKSAAQLIKQARSAAGLTQAELAARLATGQSVVARLEQPDSNPTVETLEQLLRACDHRLELRVKRSPRNVDETLVAAQLRLPAGRRLAGFQAAYDEARDFARAAERRHGKLA